MMNDLMGTTPRELDDLITDMTTLMVDGFGPALLDRNRHDARVSLT
ncbi:MAG: hypothetical protein R2710_28140 [Acidimicrobiales bacterium]